MSFDYYTLESINTNRKAYIQLKRMHDICTLMYS